MRDKLCKQCKTKFTPTRPLQSVCGYECGIKYSNLLKVKKESLERKKINKVDKEKLKNMAISIKNRSDYVRELQPLVNKIARMIDFDQPCISSGNKSGKVNGGHYWPTSSHPKIRFNLFNIYLQSEYSNTYKHGDFNNYTKGLEKTFGEEHLKYVQDLPIIYSDLDITTDLIKEAIKRAKEVIKELQSVNSKQSNEKRIELRKQINILIGIY